jgi:uncharacterized small protein (DUF1192 family)
LAAEIERLRAERDDLMKANALLHALIGNREAEIERLKADKDVIRSQERNAAYERDIAALEAEIERLRAALKEITSGGLGLFGSKQVARAALEQKSP